MLPVKTIETNLIFKVRARYGQSRNCNFGMSGFLLYNDKNCQIHNGPED